MSKLARALSSFDAPTFARSYGGYKETRSAASTEYMFSCPSCNGSNLRWNAGKNDGRGSWICWNCYERGNTLMLIQTMTGCTSDEAIGKVLDGYVGGDANLDLGGNVGAPAPPKPVLSRLPLMSWPRGAVPIQQHPGCLAYMRARGVSDELLVAHGIYAGTAGRTAGYVLFPVVMDGGMVYWQGRASWNPPEGLDQEARRAWRKTTKYRKTLNPYSDPDGPPQAAAGDVLYGYDRAMYEDHVVVVEGPVDAIQVGWHAVALLGKGTPAKLERLRRMRVSRYTIYLDRGEQERAKALSIAAELAPYAPVYIAEPPEGYDPGSLPELYNAEVISAAAPHRAVAALASALVP